MQVKQALCEKEGKYRYSDIDGNELLEPIYDLVTNVEDGKVFIKRSKEKSGDKNKGVCGVFNHFFVDI